MGSWRTEELKVDGLATLSRRKREQQSTQSTLHYEIELNNGKSKPPFHSI